MTKKIEKKQGFKKKISILAMVLVAMLVLSACGQSKVSSGSGLDSIKDRGYIVMGLDDTFAPMGFRDNAGELVGFDIDLAKEVFKRADVNAGKSEYI